MNQAIINCLEFLPAKLAGKGRHQDASGRRYGKVYLSAADREILRWALEEQIKKENN